MYRAFLSEEFDRALGRLSRSDRDRVEKKILKQMSRQLKQEPHYGPNIKKLRGYEPETWRYRIGDFRVFYTIDETAGIVNILTIAQRKEAYR